MVPFRDEFFGVPPDGDETIRLTRQELAVFNLHDVLLVQRLAGLLGFAPAAQAIPGRPQTAVIGTLTPSAGYRFKVFLAVPGDPDDFRRTVEAVAVRTRRPFLLCVPTRRFCAPDVEELLSACAGGLLPLDECLEMDERHRLHLTDDGRTFLADFLELHLPKREAGEKPTYFATPADASWCDVRMRFLDGETVTVTVGEEVVTLNYTQLGMASRRNGRPTRQWELLRIFAAGYGQFDWSNRQADRRHQKQKELLSKRLRAFFRIDGEPIRAAGNGWQTRFSIQPDA